MLPPFARIPRTHLCPKLTVVFHIVKYWLLSRLLWLAAYARLKLTALFRVKDIACGSPKMLAYGTHPFCCHASRTRPLEEIIKWMKGHPKDWFATRPKDWFATRPKVWFATREEIADWMLENYPDHDLSKFYPEAVASDRHYGLGLGLGGAEAQEKLSRWRAKK